MLRAMVGPLALFLIWWVTFELKLVSPRLLPSPIGTVESLVQSLFDGSMLVDFGYTVTRTFYAFAIASLLGIPLGIVAGADARIYASLEFLVDFFRSTPATAMFPLFLLIFGLGDVSKVAVAAFAAFLIVFFNVAYGVMNARQTRMLAAKVMGASRFQVFRDVLFFEALPQTFIGLRTAVSLALVVIIVAEMFIGSDNGLGHRIIDMQIVFNLKQMYATILMTGVLGYGLNLLFLLTEHKLVHWAGR
ncbi:MAG: ABC transporter permease [Hyphomicrobiales bacterium]|nr:MAG: ABC transporter permease [Hyphomicrobiales bacterium]